MPVATRVHISRPDDKEFAIERVQDVEPIIEHCEMLRSQPQRSDWGRHLGTVPNVIYEQLLNREWERGNKSILWDHKAQHKMLVAYLKDIDHRKFRVDK
jgi:hypothetical protein